MESSIPSHSPQASVYICNTDAPIGRWPVPSSDDLPEVSRAPRSGLILMLAILIALALIAVYANVQKARRDKIEKVTIVPVSATPAASPSPTD